MKESNVKSHERFVRAIHKTVFVLDKIADKLLRDNLQITFSQFLILMAISRHKGISQRAVAEFLGITPAAVSRHIDHLLAQKLLMRKENTRNRREHMLELTAAGSRSFEKTLALLTAHFKKVLGGLSEKEIIATADILEKLLKQIGPLCEGASEIKNT